jgi:integrase/recombinase XerD
MMPFTSPLGPHMEGFLELKRALGRRYETVEVELRCFDRYVTGLDEPPEFMTRDLVHGWLGTKPHVRPTTQKKRAAVLRQFCLYLARFDRHTYVPDRALFPARGPIYKAHIYSEEQLRALLRAALTVVPDRYAFRRETVHTMLLTLYATGLRAGEACRLRVGDVDLAARTLFVCKTKFFKSRLVPFSEGLAEKLRSYLEARTAAAPPAGVEAPFFVNRCRRAVVAPVLSAVFHELVAAVGIPRRVGVRGPCLHELRHSFAVHRVLRWYREGADVQAKLPLLATYMGHGSVLATHVYLTATAELLQEASQRFERAYGSLVVGPEEIIHEDR